MSNDDGQDRYHPVARTLHWSMVILIAAQFVLGYAIDRADDLAEMVFGSTLAGEEGTLVLLHVILGVMILLLAVARLAWRTGSGLPAWAPGLAALERRIAHRIELLLYAAMFLIPLTGIALVLLSGDDWELGRGQWRAPVELIDDDLLLGAHIATQLVFFAALATHVGLVLKHQLLDRDRLLRRML